MTIGQKQLETAGYTNVKPLGTKTVWGRDWLGNATTLGPAEYGKWFKAVSPAGETVLILRQSANVWHAFFTYTGTASGSSPERAVKGGLGDAINTDSEMRAYSRMVNKAPASWCDEFEGLHAAKGQVYHDMTAR